jgi:hypothetical protein
LHLPLDEGRASLTLFALPCTGMIQSHYSGSDAVAARESNLPLVLASFEWKVPNGVNELKLSRPADSWPTSASPVTQMNWTRTGTSFDILYTLDLNGAEARLNASDLICLESGTALNLVRRGTSDPLHLQSRLERNPLYVHRHLAVLSTVKKGGIGRSIEIYDTARRVVGRNLPINLKGKTDAAVRIATFETPARPLLYAPPHAKPQSAKFDLFAVIGDKYDDARPAPKGLSFTYRPLGGDNGESELASLEFMIVFGGQSATVSINLKKARTLSAVHFSIADNKIAWICVLPDGSTEPRGDITVVLNIDLSNPQNETIEVIAQNFKDANGIITKNYWGDISMLTLPAEGDCTSFSWNWMFTGRNLPAAEAVTVPRLLTVAEAEARIIAVSPPIPVIGVTTVPAREPARADPVG